MNEHDEPLAPPPDDDYLDQLATDELVIDPDGTDRTTTDIEDAA